MKFKNFKFKDLFIIKHKMYIDDRGYFKVYYKKDLLENKLGYKINFCQENNVFSKQNVIRGLHFQLEPFAQSKMITVVKGKILDIAVDIRKNSSTYGNYFSYVLSSENHETLFIPKGFAHGYRTISKEAIINYKVDDYYNPKMESGIAYNDPYLNIDWMIDEKSMIISQKDKKQKPFKWVK